MTNTNYKKRSRIDGEKITRETSVEGVVLRPHEGSEKTFALIYYAKREEDKQFITTFFVFDLDDKIKSKSDFKKFDRRIKKIIYYYFLPNAMQYLRHMNYYIGEDAFGYLFG